MIRAIASVLFCAVLCSCYSSCVGYAYMDCGSTLGSFSSVSVSGCDTNTESCHLIRGTNATINIKFKPNTDISQVNLHVFGVILDVEIPFPMDKPDVCKDLECGVHCPLRKDQEYNYTTSMFVKKAFPKVKVQIKWEFVDAHNQMIVCIQFPAKIWK
ncbi:NPC intracellular cholesterol transporter 2 homolog a-like [Odontomachus brunneus]|uniref:NPC intracellular cholesterol transporter 2 homolog a-like n=1 Tax=Odontomachus brunneus TaxID=486640 RepID=UPI0013F1E7F0|nr:NPC intracellular cholesterol transporter 2 homolog a-like [Odontomachus brunneus]